MNIPSNDPGVKLVPNATAFCEWLVRLAGGIATCVEVSEMVCDHVATKGRIPVSAAEDISLANDLIARGDASPNGATNYVAASNQMSRLGIKNSAYGASWFASNDPFPLVKAAIDRGVAVLWGVYAAFNFHDDWTNAPEDQGVYGHGVAVVGYDNSGFIVADPNTSQAESGNFVHYTAANMRAAGGQFPSMVIPEVSNVAVTDAGLGKGFTDYAVAHNISAPQVEGGEHFNEPNPGESWCAWDGAPVLTYTPVEGVQDGNPGRIVKFLDAERNRLAGALSALQSDVSTLEASNKSLAAQVATLQAELAKGTAVDPSVVTALQSASQLLAPGAAAAAEVAVALKAVGA